VRYAVIKKLGKVNMRGERYNTEFNSFSTVCLCLADIPLEISSERAAYIDQSLHSQFLLD